MKIGLVQQKNLAPFATLLLPQAAKAVERGEPLLCLGATTDQGVACGAVAGYMRQDAWQVTSLYVAPDHRRQGVAKALVSRLIGVLKGAEGLKTLEVDYTITLPEHETLEPFFQAMDFASQSVGDLGIYGCTLSAVAQQSFFSVKEGNNPDIVPFSAIPRTQLRQTQQCLEQLGIPLPEHGLSASSVDMDVSVAYVQNGQIEALIQVERLSPEQIHLALAWSNASPQILVVLLKTAFRQSAVRYPPHTQLTIHTATEVSLAIMKRLLPQVVPLSRRFGYGLK